MKIIEKLKGHSKKKKSIQRKEGNGEQRNQNQNGQTENK